MNSTIISILKKQDYYNFGSDILNLEDEEFLFNYIAETRHLDIKYYGLNPSHGLINRLNIVSPFIVHYFNTNNIQKNCKFIFNLGDCVRNTTKSIPTLCFSKGLKSNAILVPNIDFFTNAIIKILNLAQEDISYSDKIDGSIFAGESTGPKENNTRIKYCLDVAKRGSHNHLAKITNLCQASKEEWTKIYGNLDQIFFRHISIRDQMRYKILTNIDGNTVCYSRLFWQMMSNSIPVYINKNTEIQLFDYFDYSDSYFSSTLESYWNDYSFILDPKNDVIIQDKIIKGQNYCNLLFGGYLQDPNVYIHEILKYIFHQLGYDTIGT
jgi:hypothetical protein